MAKNLTESDVFSTPITVPEGTDFMDDAADAVELIAQRLANRTKNINDHAARWDVANTFTQPQAIPNVSGSMAIANDLAVTDAVSCHTLDATADIYAGDDVIAQDEFQYGTPPTRSKSINVVDGTGSGTPINNGQYMELGAAEQVQYAVRAPHGGALGTVRIKAVSASGTDVNMRLYRKAAPNFGSTSLPAYGPPVVMGATTLSAGVVTNMSASFGGIAVDKNETYTVVISNEGAGDVVIVGVEYDFLDPGPRNH